MSAATPPLPGYISMHYLTASDNNQHADNAALETRAIGTGRARRRGSVEEEETDEAAAAAGGGKLMVYG